MSIKDLKLLITIVYDALKSTPVDSDKFKELLILNDLLRDILKRSIRELERV